MGTSGGILLTLSECTWGKVYPRENALEGETIVLAPLHVYSWAGHPRDPGTGWVLGAPSSRFPFQASPSP